MKDLNHYSPRRQGGRIMRNYRLSKRFYDQNRATSVHATARKPVVATPPPPPGKSARTLPPYLITYFFEHIYPVFHSYVSWMYPHIPQIIEIVTTLPSGSSIVLTLILLSLVVDGLWRRDLS
jgi:hypothetical protein